jgi:malate dehydrogenase (oxaloacetate-decarboxylating)
VVGANLPGGSAPLLPSLGMLRDSTRKVALTVALAAVDDGVAPKATEADLRGAIEASQWVPKYDF